MAVELAPSIEEILSLPDDGYRHELVSGVHHVSPPPGGPHQIAVVELATRLRATCPRGHRVLVAPFAWVVTDPDGGRHEVQPDLLVVTSDQARRVRLEGDLPRLVVEVLSPGAANRARDLEDKFALYQAVGVPIYWVVDPAERAVLAWRLIEGQLRQEAEVRAGEAFSTEWPWPLSFRPDDLA
ncbi:MAG: Uma2 family endonuclease [Acidimicrobiales bacterium]